MPAIGPCVVRARGAFDQASGSFVCPSSVGSECIGPYAGPVLHHEVRQAVKRRLRAEHGDGSDTLYRDELGICLGETRMDVAAINGQISGYEIKGDRDRQDRLARQIVLYSKVVDFAVLVTEGRFAGRGLDLVPEWWGVWRCVPNGTWPTIELVRSPSVNPITDPFAIAQLLWRDEVSAELQDRGLAGGLRLATRWKLWDVMVANLSPTEISETARRRLRARRGW